MNKDRTMSSPYNSGYLEIILGSMYSGKSTRLVEIYKQCKFCNISVAVINHCSDNRYDDELLSTHDKIKIPCIKTEKLFDIWTDPSNMEENIALVPRIKDKFKVATSDVILINEGQFFPDLEEFVKTLLEYNKKIYICGLDGDFERKQFGQILNLIPLCDEVSKLTSLCSLCKNGSKGIFSMRLSNETEQMVVGSDNYIPVCRRCYEKNSKRQSQQKVL
jgi:thymidine kinase